MWEILVQFLSWEDPLEEGMATHSNILAWRIPMNRGAWWATYSPWGHKESDTTERLSTAQGTLLSILSMITYMRRESKKEWIYVYV